MNARSIWATLLLLSFTLPLLGCGDESGSTQLITVEDAKQANLILVRLEESGVTGAQLRDESSSRAASFVVSVPADQLAASRRVLVRYDLPRSKAGGFDDMLAGNRLIPTATEERARLMHAAAGELAKTFEMWDRIVDARVHLTVPEKDSLSPRGADQAAPSALVALRFVPGSNASRPIEDEEVRRMVIAAIANLGGTADENETPPDSSRVIVQWAEVESVGSNDSSGMAEQNRALTAELEALRGQLSGGVSPGPAQHTPRILLGATRLFAILTLIFGALFLIERRKGNGKQRAASDA